VRTGCVGADDEETDAVGTGAGDLGFALRFEGERVD